MGKKKQVEVEDKKMFAEPVRPVGRPRTQPSTCPRCGAEDTIAYRVENVTDGRVHYRRCQRGICRHLFKTFFPKIKN